MSETEHPLRRHADTMTEEELSETFGQCPVFHNHTDVTMLHADLQEIKQTLAEMKEIVTAWNDAKGFIKTVRIIGEVLKWAVAVGAALLALWYTLTGRGGR